MEGQTVERRSDPRRGIAVRVGLAVTATGLMSVALDRRALTGAVYDVPVALTFALALGLLAIASFRRPVRGAVWIALGAVALVHVEAAVAVAGNALGGVLYAAVAAAATAGAAAHLRPLVLGAFALWTPALWLYRGGEGIAALPPALVVASAIALAHAVYAIGDRRWLHPSDRLRRAGHGMLAIAIASAAAARTLLVGPRETFVDLIALAAIVALVVLAGAAIAPRTRDLAATIVALVAFGSIGLAYVGGTSYGADAVAAAHRAAEHLVRGEQPYAAFDLLDALARFGIGAEWATHLEDGSVLHTYAYPALSFLYLAPFVAAGLDDVRWVYLGVVIVFAAVAARRLRPAWRPFALATVVGSEIVTRQFLVAGVDPLWALLLLGAWATRERRWASAALLGLAVADRQPAWFAAPFLLLAVAQEGGAREAVRRAAIALAIAVAVNAPFVLGAPDRAIAGILAPMLVPLQPDGVGLVLLGATDRYLTPLPRLAYTLLAAAAFAALLALLWRRRAALAGAPLVFPFLPLWLAWRSLPNYFAFAAPFALVADDEIAVDSPAPPAA